MSDEIKMAKVTTDPVRIMRVSGNGQSIADLAADVAQLQDDVGGIQDDVGEIQDDVAGIQADVTQLQTDVSGVSSTVSGMATDVSDLSEDVGDLKSVVKNNNKVLVNANVNASGEIIYASQYDLYVFQTPENGFIDSLKTPDGTAVYAYFTTEPVVGSTSYNSGRTVASGTEIKSLFVPSGCNYIAIRQDHTHAASIYPQNAIDVAQFIANQQIGFKSLISANADLNNYNDPGVYQYSTSDNIAHDPFNGIGGTTIVISIKANMAGVNGSVSQFAYQYGHMEKGFMFRQENSQHVWTAWKNIGIFDQASGASVPSTKVFGYSDFDDNDSVYLNEMRYRKVVYGGGKIYCGTFCGTNTDFPYYFSVITGSNGRFYRQSISVQHYGITINVDGTDVDFSTLRDSDNYTMQISDMEYYNGYLYCAMRWGAGAGSDPTVNNSYLIVIDTSTMQTSAWFAMKTDRISTVHVDAGKKLLVTGDRGGGFTVYDLTNPGVPSKIASHSQTGIIEYQHSDVYTNGSNETCIAFGVYTSGVAGYKLSGSTITDLFTWNGLSEIGSNLNVFAVAVRYPYLYATICPMNNARQNGSRIMGIVTLDISDPSNIVNYGFTPIPESMCGDYPAYIVNTNGTLSLAGPADPAPNYIKVNGNYLYVSNENKGIAVFDLTSYKYPRFAGLIPTGTWNRYFSISDNLIFTGGDYDYLTGDKPKVVITSCAL